MRLFQSSIFRAVCAIIIGVLLIKFPDNTVHGITVAIGVLFLVSGLIAFVAYLNARRHAGEYKIYDAEGHLLTGEQPTFPIVGVGSIILGLILALSPTAFVSALMYVIGAILILGAINQYMSLVSARRFGPMPLWYWVMPTLILLTGLYVVIKPMAPLSMAMLVLGWCTLLYGVTEIVNALKIHSARRRMQREQEQANELPEIEEVVEPEAPDAEETAETDSYTPVTIP